ncbi:MAG: ArsR/SmtB family transcription factor [Erythrobacter sp.]
MGEDDLIEALKALAHPLRFRILAVLAGGERNVGEIEQVTGIAQPGLSQQLGVLRKAELVETRKQAKLVYYSISAARLGAVTAALAALVPGLAIPPAAPAAPAALRTPAPGVANFARMS